MTKEELIDRLEDSRDEFLDLLDQVPDEEMEIPGAAGEWSVKNLLAHLNAWEAELIKLLFQAKQGLKPSSTHFSGQNVDEINARWQAESQNRDLERIFSDFQGIRKQTVRRVSAFTDKELNDTQRYRWQQGRPLWQWIAADTYEHEQEHAEQLGAWLTQRS